MVITTIIIFLLVLGLLVLVHEAGHFIMAKRAGAKVEEFGFGFPPRIFGVQKGETMYSINLIPLGGFVRIVGENGEDKENPRSFAAKSIWQRFQILVAGVTANVILAIVFFSVFAFGRGYTPTILSADEMKSVKDVQVMILGVGDNSPAKNAGLNANDIIISLGADSHKIDIKKEQDVESFISANRGKEILFTIKRGDQTLELKALARTEVSEKEGATGIALGEVGIVRSSWYEAIRTGIKNTFYAGSMIFFAFYNLIKNLIISGQGSGSLTGPIGIADMVGQTAQIGIIYLLQFIAFLSINLAVINALPFPALDGGRILFLAIEKIKGKPVDQEMEGKVHAVGMMILLLLMALVTLKDIQTYHIWQKITNFF